jgi:hypothetical protein
VGDETAQDAIGRIEIADASQPELAAQTILQHAPETLDAPLGLRALGGNEGDAQLIQCAAKLGGLAFSDEFFFDRPVVVVADENAAAIPVKGDGNAKAVENPLQESEVALRGFSGEELGGQDFVGGIILHTQSGEMRTTTLEPVVRGTVQLYQFSFAPRPLTALAMSQRAAFAGRADAGSAEQTAKGLTAERETFLLDQFLVKVMIVESGIATSRELQDAGAGTLG